MGISNDEIKKLNALKEKVDKKEPLNEEERNQFYSIVKDKLFEGDGTKTQILDNFLDNPSQENMSKFKEAAGKALEAQGRHDQGVKKMLITSLGAVGLAIALVKHFGFDKPQQKAGENMLNMISAQDKPNNVMERPQSTEPSFHFLEHGQRSEMELGNDGPQPHEL